MKLLSIQNSHNVVIIYKLLIQTMSQKKIGLKTLNVGRKVINYLQLPQNTKC